MKDEDNELQSVEHGPADFSEEFREELDRGDAHFEKGRYRRGLARIEEAIQWEPENPHYLFEAGRCYWRLDEPAQAKKLFDAAAKAPGAPAQVRYYAALANVFSDRPTDAVRLLADRPDDEEIPAPLLKEWTRLEAFATASAGNPAEGIRVLSRVRQPVDAENIVRDVELLATLASPSPDICQATADVFENLHALSPGVRGRIARLVGDLYCLSGHDEDALTWWNTAFDLTRGNDEAQRVCWMCEQRALTSLKAKHFEDGLAWCQRGLAVDPQNKVLSGLQQDMHLLAAEAEWEKGAIEEATSLWKSMSQSGNSFDAAWNRAVASERSRETKDMIQAWQDVIKLAQEQSNPEVALEAMLRTASLYWRLGDGDQARSLLEQASKLSSKEPTAHRLLALMSLSRDMDENSSQSVKTVLERAHAAQPDDPLINLALAAAHDDSDAPLESKIERWHEALKHVDEKDWVQGVWRERTLELGLSAWKKGDLDRAMTIFSGILLEDRFDPDGWIWCGTIHLQLGKEDLARVCFDKALTNAPKSAHTLLKIGGCYLMAGREDEAHQHFAQAQKADPSSATDLQIAEVCLEIGRKDIAFKHLSEAINRSDSHSSDLYRIAQLLIQVNEGQVLRPLLEKLASVIDKPYRMHFLIAVEQIWASEWREAQNTLEQIREAAESHDDSQLLDDVRHAERTMILLLTTGEVDPVESSDRVKLATNRWVLEQSPAEDDRPITRMRRRAGIWFMSFIAL